MKKGNSLDSKRNATANVMPMCGGSNRRCI